MVSASPFANTVKVGTTRSLCRAEAAQQWAAFSAHYNGKEKKNYEGFFLICKQKFLYLCIDQILGGV
jgi:hypothetical protein